jgi:hypothetical protein
VGSGGKHLLQLNSRFLGSFGCKSIRIQQHDLFIGCSITCHYNAIPATEATLSW